MNYSTLQDFRNGLYGCFDRAGDALMNVCDALLTESTACSFAELSLSPCFDRRWSSLYEAFDDGKINTGALRRLLIETLPPVSRRVLAADVSPIVRPESVTARDRTYVHVPNAPKGAKPVAPGYQFATVCALPPTPSSWTSTVDVRRVPSDQTSSVVVAAQLKDVASHVPEDTVAVLDGGFGNAPFLLESQDVPLTRVVRIANNRVFYRPAPPPTGQRGAPRKDGDRFALADPSTHGQPDQEFHGVDALGQDVTVCVWHQMHLRSCRQVTVSLARIERAQARDTERDPRVLWLMLVLGPGQPPLEPADISVFYRLRYCIEHGYRFDKQELLWTAPRLRTPEKLETWSWVVAAVHDLITLARPLVQGQRHPWQTRSKEATPAQVRRALGLIIAKVGTPARTTRLRGKSPGRAKGDKIEKAERFKTIYKQTDKKKKEKIN